jgi:hypothetical protein
MLLRRRASATAFATVIIADGSVLFGLQSVMSGHLLFRDSSDGR